MLKSGPVLSALLVLFCTAAHAEGPSGQATVQEVKGEVWKVSRGKKQALKAGDTIRPGARLETGAKGTVVLVFDEAAVAVDPKTQVELGGGTSAPGEVSVRQGGLQAVIRKAKEQADQDRFVIRSRAAVMGVRGTALYVQTSKDKPDFLCVCKGQVEVRSRSGQSSTTVQTTAHNPTVIAEGDAEIESRISSTKEVPAEHMAGFDPLIERLEKLVSAE